MRLGTSGLGVIAVVSLLVTAAPERDDSVENHRRSRIDHSRSIESWRTSSTRYSWPSQVATEPSSRRTSSFVKIELEGYGSTSSEASRRLPHSSIVTSLQHNNRKPEIPTVLLRFTTDFPYAHRVLVKPRNSKNADVSPDVQSANNSPNTTLENNGSIKVVPSVPNSASSVFEEKLAVSNPTLLSLPLPRRRRRGERETFTRRRETEIQDNNDYKRSMTNFNEATKLNSSQFYADKISGTMNNRLTTMTTTRRSLLDENFRNQTKRYAVKIVRGTRESSRNKETTEMNNDQPHFRNGQGESNAVTKSTMRTMSGEANDALHSESLYLTNYTIYVSPTVHFEEKSGDSIDSIQRLQDEPAADRLTADKTVGKSEILPNQFVLVDKSLKKMETPLNEDSLVRDDAIVKQQGFTAKSMVDFLVRKSETHGYSSVTEEIAQVRQMTSESSLEIPTIERPLLRSSGSASNTSMADLGALLDNHKAVRVRSFQTTRIEQQQNIAESHLESSLTSRLPYEISVKDTVGVERQAIPANQLTIPKSAFTVAKNLSKSTINHVDGKPKKKYYEIKPSLITEMDHGVNHDVTTTPKRIFDKFLLPSVPSAFGKFGPYFLDEEDRRNVTERIGNTVQLDCRIGLLGHRKVTWLQHYKDSFRLLTVERESYSVDRRISLNFQYPDNWRLQIAYASLRDSGLYKCQVEIDQDRSLVKRYNVIITAPILTITDDSGRPVSGERHLKAGSALKLRCEARDVIQRLNESVLWMRGDETLTEDVSENRTTEIVNEKEITVIVSTLLVEPRHTGNYSCVVPEKARTTIAVHVLNGELPAAVQHNSGVSTAVLNLWFIHLTASYGFFR